MYMYMCMCECFVLFSCFAMFTMFVHLSIPLQPLEQCTTSCACIQDVASIPQFPKFGTVEGFDFSACFELGSELRSAGVLEHMERGRLEASYISRLAFSFTSFLPFSLPLFFPFHYISASPLFPLHTTSPSSAGGCSLQVAL